MKDKKTLSDCVKSSEELRKYLSEKAKSHKSYKYYSNLETISKIIEERALCLSVGENWNDKTDRTLFAEGDNYVRFGKCFSYAQDENVAMWMLYGGIYHKGAMIDFTQKAINSILDIKKISLCHYDKKTKKSKHIKYVSFPDFHIEIYDMIYCNEKNRYIKRSDEACVQVDKRVLDELGPYKKSYPWHYESECRLIVSVNKSIVPDNCNSVKLDLGGLDVSSTFNRVYHSPDYKGENMDGFRSSKLYGSIDFQLLDEKCEKCKRTER